MTTQFQLINIIIIIISNKFQRNALNWILHSEDIQSGGTAALVLPCRNIWTWVDSFTIRPFYTKVKNSKYALNREIWWALRKVWTHYRKGSIFPLPDIDPRFHRRPPRSPYQLEKNRNENRCREQTAPLQCHYQDGAGNHSRVVYVQITGL